MTQNNKIMFYFKKIIRKIKKYIKYKSKKIIKN